MNMDRREYILAIFLQEATTTASFEHKMFVHVANLHSGESSWKQINYHFPMEFKQIKNISGQKWSSLIPNVYHSHTYIADRR